MGEVPYLKSVKDASLWASNFLNKEVTESNINYLIQYGKIKKYYKDNKVVIDLYELENYYKDYNNSKRIKWESKLGNSVNWELSFENLNERDTTKHVHKLHPYKGKFIPQLVEYFLDEHIDEFKLKTYFTQGDIILDPFAGSGTTLVQANELGIHGIGVDISEFNCAIINAKLNHYDIAELNNDIDKVIDAVEHAEIDETLLKFYEEISDYVDEFNNRNFPSVIYKQRIRDREINETSYYPSKEEEVVKKFYELACDYDIPELRFTLGLSSFIHRWCNLIVRDEAIAALDAIETIRNPVNKNLLHVILSRTVRSCRATTHSDLVSLKEPQITPYYCWKHKKICKPISSMKAWFKRYCKDSVERIKQFELVRTNAKFKVVSEDSRNVNIVELILKDFHGIILGKGIKGIFTSPPYLGHIDYHEQHAYAYDLLNISRRDDLEIGAMKNGTSNRAKEEYVKDISKVLKNCKSCLVYDFDIFIVANDKYNLYPLIAKEAGLKIVNQFKRPVLNRAERDRNPYVETIFHMKRG